MGTNQFLGEKGQNGEGQGGLSFHGCAEVKERENKPEQGVAAEKESPASPTPHIP